jgi:hypothetical protein
MNDVTDFNNAKYLKFRTKFFISEFFGTALLLLGGLSVYPVYVSVTVCRHDPYGGGNFRHQYQPCT